MCARLPAIWRGLGLLWACDLLRRVWSGPFDAEDGLKLDEVEAKAKSPELDEWLRPLEEGLAELPEVKATDAGGRAAAQRQSRHGDRA